MRVAHSAGLSSGQSEQLVTSCHQFKMQEIDLEQPYEKIVRLKLTTSNGAAPRASGDRPIISHYGYPQYRQIRIIFY